MATTILSKDIKAGDMVLAIHGRTLNAPVAITKVVEVTPERTVHVQVVQEDTLVTPDRYLPEGEVTVERTKRQATRTFHGIKFLKQDDGSWVTEDGKWSTALVDDFETECDAAHPVRITPRMREGFAADMARLGRRVAMDRWGETGRAIEEGRKGFQCQGGEIHFYSQWVAGPTRGTDVVNREDTFAASASHLARFIKGEAESRA